MELPAYMQPPSAEPKYLRLDAVFINPEMGLRADVYHDSSVYIEGERFRVVLRDLSADQMVGVRWSDRDAAMKLADIFVAA